MAAAKLKAIFERVAFKQEGGLIQRNEVEYVVHLVTKWIEVSANYKITDTALLTRVCDTLFQKRELVSIDEVVAASI